MQFLILFIRAYPGQSTIMLTAMLLAGLSEGFGLSAMLPLLSTVIGNYSGGEQALASISPAERIVREGLSFLGIPPTLELLLLVVICAIIFKSILVLLANKRVGYTVAQVATDLRLELLRALIASRWEFHLHQSVGTLANAMVSEGYRASKAYHSAAAMTIAAIQAVVYVGVACLVSWKATLAALVGGLFIFYILKRLVRKARNAGERQTKVLKSLTGYLVDSLQSIKPIKAMALEHLAESVLAKEANKLNKALRKQVISKEFLRAFQEPLRFVFLLGALYAALVFLRLPVATVMVLLFLIARVLIQLGRVQEQYQKMVILESGYWSLMNKIEEAKQDNEEIVGTRKPILKKAISFDRVSFAYGENWVLRDVSLSFSADQITAIVGPSGSGKTTILDLLIGLLRPQQGEIFIDDLPMAEIDLRRWRQMIGYVPQEMWLLHDTVFNNVTLGDPELKKEDVERALQAAGAWEFVQAMPQGINSTVGERGGKISGGQRQRIAIARALVHQPKLLILDEATTALDPENEKAICSTLRDLRGSLTILAISHQPAVLEIADQAYRLQDKASMQLGEIGQPVGLKSDEIEIDAKQKLQLITDPAKLQ
jgi:ATP-binding cassette subfamily C protein